MLLHDQQIRLTGRERAVLHQLTGSDPHYVTTRAELKEWVDCHLQASALDGQTSRLLKDLLRKHLPL
ncbi:hypothetical protein [Marinobacter sp.]|uniref:hypothetical protein n=1 Tax=Marinobacter sp. TaxID=50741 RepID=UPI00384C5B41